MTWWGYAILSAACWGLQYVLLEALLVQVDFASAYSFLSLVNGFLVTALLLVLYPKQNWAPLWENWLTLRLVLFYVLSGTFAYLFNALAISQKNATLASLLEISYPVFIIIFTFIFLRKIHLNTMGFGGALMIIAGCAVVVFSKSQ
ncbi:MAG: EamA family transporter [Verrucomicrobia bacterium]|nr:EamA family transporter [Verrucomicrobiota bacterium]MBV9673477.1 EamA family transporter [Verrucomicrobiota bacterium]